MAETSPHLLDLTGYKCPIPVIKTEAALRQLPAGATVQVIADDPMAAIDIPLYCQQAGHLVEDVSADDGICVFLVTCQAKINP
ncbi:MAG: sulfurtransferase TusA family protein [bacterium]